MIAWLSLACVLATEARLQDPLAPYRNLPIVSINVKAPPRESKRELKSLIAIEPGYLLSARDLQIAVQRLYALGRFADVRVEAERLSGAVELTFTLLPILRLADLEFEGVQKSNEAALRQATGLRPFDEIDSTTVNTTRDKLKKYLSDNSFPHASVDVQQLERPGGEVLLRVTLKEGEPQTIHSIELGGQLRLSPGLLATYVYTKPGDILERSRLQDDKQRLQRALVEQDFLEARVDEPSIRHSNKGIVIFFPVTTGKRIGARFAGNVQLSTTQLEKIWQARRGRARPQDLNAVTQEITRRYAYLGYPDAVVERAEVPMASGDRVIAWKIREGMPTRVAAISFPGATVYSEDVLTAQVTGLLRQQVLGDETFLPIHDDELRPTLGMTTATAPGVGVDDLWIESVYAQAAEQIAAVYKNRGYLQAEVGPARTRIVPTKGQAKSLAVEIPVREGPLTKVRTVRFVHNRAFEASTLLAQLEDQAAQDASNDPNGGEVVHPGSAYSANGVEDGRIALVRYYRNNGYLYMRLFTETLLSDDGTSAEVTYRFEEGPEVRVGSVVIRGNRYTKDDVIASRITLAPGDIYRLEQALSDQRSIASLGVFTHVRVRLIDEDVPAERKDVVAEVVERNRQSVDVWPGFSTADGPRVRLDYNHNNLFGSATALALSLKLNWQVFFGFYGASANVLEDRYAEFDGFERTEAEARVGLRSPRFLNIPMRPLGRVDLVFERDNRLPYSLTSGRLVFGADFEPVDRLSLTFEPQLALTQLECFATSDQGAAPNCRDEVTLNEQRAFDPGLRASFGLGPSITYDGRDDPFSPTRGLYATLRANWAWIASLPPESQAQISDLADLGLNQWAYGRYTKAEGIVSGYIPLPARWVLALSARGGKVFSGVVPIDERYYLGGGTTMRGFFNDSIFADDFCARRAGRSGPSRTCNETVTVVDTEEERENLGGDAVLKEELVTAGGNIYALLKAELRVPLRNNLSLGLFVDTGNLWLTSPLVGDVTFRATTGAGLRYGTPVGPVGIDVGYNPSPRRLLRERSGDWHFALGVF